MRRTAEDPDLTDRIALALAAAILMAFVLDFTLTGGAASLFLARKFLGIVDWAMFWR